MGRFAKLMGKLEFKIKDMDFVLVPTMGDNRELMGIMNNKKLEEMDKINQMSNFITKLIMKSYPEEPKEEIEAVVEFNLPILMKEILIGFGWTTHDKWESLQGEAEKKLI